MTRPFRVFIAGLLWIACIVLREPLEADPVTHILVLLPCLALAGGLLVSGLPASWTIPTTTTSNCMVLVAVFVILYWMLPRAIDASLSDWVFGLAKFLSIPIFVGGILAPAWPRAHPFLRGFLKANAISMFGILAYLYTHAPVRICNSYLVVDQERLGFGLFLVAFGLAIAWAIPLFLPPRLGRDATLGSLRKVTHDA